MTKIGKARKKPVVVEFMHYNGVDDMDDVREWVGKNLDTERYRIGERIYSIIIPTLEGDMRANPGDYIIKGVKGEFYPCKSDVFEKTYDIV